MHTNGSTAQQPSTFVVAKYTPQEQVRIHGYKDLPV